MLFLHNTSRVEDEPYPTLLQDKGFGGFPSLAFMDADGNVIAKQGERTVDGFQKTHAKVKALMDLRQTVARGSDEKLQKKLLMAELDLNLLSADEIKQRVAAIKNLTNEERATVDRKLVDAEVRDLQQKSRELGMEKVAEAVADIAKAGRRPSDDVAVQFWVLTLRHAENTTDGKLGEEAFGHLEKLAENDRRYARSLDAWRKMLDKAKGN